MRRQPSGQNLRVCRKKKEINLLIKYSYRKKLQRINKMHACIHTYYVHTCIHRKGNKVGWFVWNDARDFGRFSARGNNWADGSRPVTNQWLIPGNKHISIILKVTMRGSTTARRTKYIFTHDIQHTAHITLQWHHQREDLGAKAGLVEGRTRHLPAWVQRFPGGRGPSGEVGAGSERWSTWAEGVGGRRAAE